MNSVLAVVPYYLPYPGGAEKSMHEMLRLMVAAGFSASAFVPALPGISLPAPQSGVDCVDGVAVERLNKDMWLAKLEDRIRDADIVFFSVAWIFNMHFDSKVYRILFRFRNKIVYFCRGLAIHDYFPAALVVANSKTVMERLPRRPGTRCLLLTPLVSQQRANNSAQQRRYITLVNPAECKGGKVFLELARALPELLFLAQLGWRPPVPGLEALPNVTIRQPTTDIASVYAETSILLVPSLGEPFGRVALEGAYSGCLLLLHRDAGLREIPVPDFCFVDTLDVDEWRGRLLRLWSADEGTKVELLEQIQRMANTYDAGWNRFLAEVDQMAVQV